MIHSLKHLLCLMFLVVFTVSCSDSQPSLQSETHVGNGGDEVAAAFIAVAEEIVQDLQTTPIDSIDLSSLESAIDGTEIVSEEKVYLKDREVSGLNFPDSTPPTIKVNRSMWNSLTNESPERKMFVLHEYLGILGIEDSSYEISSQFRGGGVCRRSKHVRKAIEDHFPWAKCHQITPNMLKSVEQLELRPKNGQIVELEKYDFHGLKQLQELRINNLHMPKLPPLLFSELRQLRLLDIRYSRVEKLTGRDAIGLENLKAISFAGPNSYFCGDEAGYLDFISSLKSLERLGDTDWKHGCPSFVLTADLMRNWKYLKAIYANVTAIEKGALDLPSLYLVWLNLTDGYTEDRLPKNEFDSGNSLKLIFLRGKDIEKFPFEHLESLGFQCKGLDCERT